MFEFWVVDGSTGATKQKDGGRALRKRLENGELYARRTPGIKVAACLSHCRRRTRSVLGSMPAGYVMHG